MLLSTSRMCRRPFSLSETNTTGMAFLLLTVQMYSVGRDNPSAEKNAKQIFKKALGSSCPLGFHLLMVDTVSKIQNHPNEWNIHSLIPLCVLLHMKHPHISVHLLTGPPVATASPNTWLPCRECLGLELTPWMWVPIYPRIFCAFVQNGCGHDCGALRRKVLLKGKALLLSLFMWPRPWMLLLSKVDHLQWPCPTCRQSKAPSTVQSLHTEPYLIPPAEFLSLTCWRERTLCLYSPLSLPSCRFIQTSEQGSKKTRF